MYRLILLILYWPVFLFFYFRIRSLAKLKKKGATTNVEAKAYKILKVFIRHLKFFYNIKTIITGIENIPQKPCLIICNHQSLADGALVTNMMHEINLVYIVKKELQTAFWWKQFFNAVDTLYMDRNDLRQSLECINLATKAIKTAHRYVLIFPEGTRSNAATMNLFKPGALKPAYAAYVPILPIVILNSHEIFFPKKIWHPITVRIVILKPLKPSYFIGLNINVLNDILFQKMQNILLQVKTEKQK